MPDKITTNGVLAIVCSIMAHSMVASLLAFRNFNDYIATFFRNLEKHTNITDTLIVIPVWNLLMATSCLTGLSLTKKWGYRATISIALGLFSVVQYGSSFIHNSGVFVLVYGSLSGVCCGVAFLPSLYLAWSYFPRNKAFVTGIVFGAGSGFNAALLALVSEAIVNPHSIDDFENDPDIYDKAPYVLRMQALVFVMLTTFVASMMPPIQVIKNREELKAEEEQKQSEEEKNSETWVQTEKERILKEFGTVYNNKSKIIGKNLAEISSIDEVLDSPIRKQAIEAATTKSMQAQAIENSPFFPLKEVKNKRDNKTPNSVFCNPVSADVHKNVVEEEKSVPLIGNSREASGLGSKSKGPMAEYLLTGHFLLLILLVFFSSLFNYYLLNIWREFFPKKVQSTVNTNSFIFVLGSILGAASSLITGFLITKVDYRIVLSFLTLISAAVAGSVNYTLKSKEVGYIFFAITFISLSGQLVVFAVLVAESFPWRVARQAYGYIFMITSLANIVQYGAADLVDSYVVLFFTFGSMALVSIPLSFTFKIKTN